MFMTFYAASNAEMEFEQRKLFAQKISPVSRRCYYEILIKLFLITSTQYKFLLSINSKTSKKCSNYVNVIKIN